MKKSKTRELSNVQIIIIVVILSISATIIAVETDIFSLITLASIYENRPIHVCSYDFYRFNRYNDTIGSFKYSYYPLNSQPDCTYGGASTSSFVPVNANTETVMKQISQEIGNQIVEYNGIIYQYSPVIILPAPTTSPSHTPLPILPPLPNPPIPTPPVPTYSQPISLPPQPPTTPAFTSLTFIVILIIAYIYRKIR